MRVLQSWSQEFISAGTSKLEPGVHKCGYFKVGARSSVQFSSL